MSSLSICLSCEQSQKVEKLERSLRERDCRIKASEDLLSNLVKKVDSLGEARVGGECGGGGGGPTADSVLAVNRDTLKESTQCYCCMQTQEMEVKVDKLREVVMENTDNSVESGRDIVEIRQKWPQLKVEMIFVKQKERNQLRDL